MKVQGNGQAKILSSDELRLLFDRGFSSPRDRALFGICLFTGCRISEALSLRANDVGKDKIVFRKQNTKGKNKSRTITIDPKLRTYLEPYILGKVGYLFEGMTGVTEHLSRFSAEKILKKACQRVGLQGVSTHSFRRTALTQMSNASVPLRTIQQISGHTNLATLQLYLEVSESQVAEAVGRIGF